MGPSKQLLIGSSIIDPIIASIVLLCTGRDADGRMLFLAPDAGKALQLVLRYSFKAFGGASFTFTLVAM